MENNYTRIESKSSRRKLLKSAVITLCICLSTLVYNYNKGVSNSNLDTTLL